MLTGRKAYLARYLGKVSEGQVLKGFKDLNQLLLPPPAAKNQDKSIRHNRESELRLEILVIPTVSSALMLNST